MGSRDDNVKQLVAGIFFLAGIALVCSMIFFIGFQKGFARPQFEVTVIFDKVGGLGEGAPVRLSGVTVGTVKAIDFLDEEIMQRGIVVTLGVYERFKKQISRSTSISVQTEGVLGSKYIEIGRNPADASLDIAQPVSGESMLDVYDLAKVLESTADSFNQTTRGINQMMGELGSISRKTKRLLDRVEQRVIDGNLFKVF